MRRERDRRERGDRAPGLLREEDDHTHHRGGDVSGEGIRDVTSVLERAVSLADLEIKHRARVQRDYRPVPLAIANDARLGQVFLNLLVNAAHAIPLCSTRS